MFKVDNKPLCNECSLQQLEENIAANKKAKVWSVVKLIFLLFFMSLGLMIYLSDPNDLVNAWIYAGIGGLPSALKNFVTRSAEEKWADEAMSRVDPGEGCFQQMLAFAIKVIFAFLLAPVAAIWFIIKNSITIAKSSRAIKEDREDCDTILLRMQEMEHLHEASDSGVGFEPQVASQPYAYVPVQLEMPMQQAVPKQTSADRIQAQPPQPSPIPPVAPSRRTPPSGKGNKTLVIGIVIGALALAGVIAAYFMWYVPYAKDRDALRTYVVANNVFVRSSKMAGVEYNVLSKVPYGSELLTYSKDMEWAEVKVNGVKGFVSSSYLFEWNDFKLLNDVWGSPDAKEYIESSKCRLAILDYLKRNQLETGSEGWQLYTLRKDIKPNNVLYPRLNNGYDKFTDFAFILKNNVTQERRLALYSFDEETEKPIFLYEENAPAEGEIKNVSYLKRSNHYNVAYTGNSTVVNPPTIKQQPKSEIRYTPPVIEEEKPEIVEDDTPIDDNVEDVLADNVDDNKIYDVVEQMPEFPNGGTTGLMNFISRNLKYPTICQETGVQGRVVVSFVVDKDGSTTDFRVVRSVNKYLDKEALRVLSSMPQWIPGKQKGVPVRVRYTVPIVFRLS